MDVFLSSSYLSSVLREGKEKVGEKRVKGEGKESEEREGE